MVQRKWVNVLEQLLSNSKEPVKGLSALARRVIGPSQLEKVGPINLKWFN